MTEYIFKILFTFSLLKNYKSLDFTT